MRAITVLIGIIFILFGMFLTFTILIYSSKENDLSGYLMLFLSLGMIAVGILMMKGKRRTDVE